MLSLACGRRARIVRNLLSDGDLSTLTVTVAGGAAVTFENDNRVAVLTVPNGAGMRALLSRTITSFIQPGRTYACSLKFDYMSEPHQTVTAANGFFSVIAIGTPATYGPQSGNSPIVSLSPALPSFNGCRLGLLFVPGALGSAAIRFGWGINAAATNGTGREIVIKLSDLQLEELELGGAGPSEYVGGLNTAGRIDREAAFDYWIEPSLSSATEGVLTIAKRKSFPVRRPSNVLFIGDSYANDGNDFPGLIRTMRRDLAVSVYALSGGDVGGILAYTPTGLRDPRSEGPAFDAVIVQGGINDVLTAPITAPPFAEMMKRAGAALDRARAAAPGARVSFVNLLPVGAAASFSYAGGDQVWIESYNAALRQFCAAEDCGYIDAYAALGIGYPNARAPSAWAATTAYAAQAIVRPTVENGLIYMVTAGGGGNSGGSEPAWPTVLGTTVVDGALTWTAYRAVIDPALSAADELHPDNVNGMQRLADVVIPHLYVNSRP